MKIVEASFDILNMDKINGVEVLKEIETIGRTCYKSEDRITDESCFKFVKNLINNGHEAMLEHNVISVRFICDRGISHELVRHRIASFAQESTRYCNYSKDTFGNELTFIEPSFLTNDNDLVHWMMCMNIAEVQYFKLLKNGCTPEQARCVLPMSLKTEIVMSMNLREWRHFFKLRCDKAAHPQMRELTVPLLMNMGLLIPIVFDDIINSIDFTEYKKEWRR